MKDEAYYKLLSDVGSRVASLLGETGDTARAFAELDLEMKKVKDILVSSGHDLQEINDFYTEVQANIFPHFDYYGS